MEADKWWWEDIPEKWEPAEPDWREAAKEPDQLEWLGDVEWEEPPRSAHPLHQTTEKVQVVCDEVKPPSLHKFKEEVEKLSRLLDLNDSLKAQASLYLPYLRPRMGDRGTTCAAVVYLVCRKAGSSKSLNDVASAAGLRPNKIFKRIQLVRNLID